jgi:hypothetical protein
VGQGFDSNAFLAEVHATGARILGRLRNNRRIPILAPPVDGSHLSTIGALRVRVVDARITVTVAGGTTFTGTHRLVTTLTDARRHPADALVALYHQRWEHESAYYALRHTITAGRVLRSGDPAGLEQEMWSLLTLYQLLRTVMVDAAESRPGTDPDRCGFTIAEHAARDQIVQATGIIIDSNEKSGVIAHRVLAALLPPRRPRVSTRKVRSPIFRYSERRDDGRPDRSRTVTALDIDVLEPPDPQPALPPLPGTTAIPRLPNVAGTGFRSCYRKIPSVSGDPATSRSTLVTSPSTPCTDNSPDGPTADSSTRSALASTPPQHGRRLPCRSTEILKGLQIINSLVWCCPGW